NLNGSLEDKVDWLGASVQKIDERQQKMDERLASLETKVDKRLKDTTPMWEAVQVQITELKQSQHQLKESQDQMRGDIQNLTSEIEKGFHLLDRRMERLAGDFNRLYGEHRVIEERLDDFDRRLTR